jgi:tetratricopeptide (TPR) repeat protein
MDINLKAPRFIFGSKPLFLAGLIFLLATALYLPTLNYDFVWDDTILIQDNPQVKSLKNGPQIFLSPFPIRPGSFLYRPLVMLSFAGDYALYKANPRGYHLTNAVIHGLTSALVTCLAWLLFQSPAGAMMAGAFFALHPAHPEAVAFIANRTDLLATLFSLLALAALLRKSEKGLGPLLGTPLFFFLALLSKETAIVVLIPMALWLWQKSPEEEKKLRAVMLKILPSVLVLILYMFLRFMVFKTLGVNMEKLKLWHSPFFLWELFLRYLNFLIFPTQRASYFYEGASSYPLDLRFWLSAGLVLLFLAALGYLIYRRRETAPLAALLLLPCLPSLGYSLYVDIVMLERYLYLPTVGLALLTAWGLEQVPAKKLKWALGGVALLLVVYLGAALWRMPLWKNEIIFFEALRKQAPYSVTVRSGLGLAYKEKNRYGEAYQELSEAVRLSPPNPFCRNNLGWVLLQLNQAPQARGEFAEALKQAPNYASALHGMGITYIMMEGDRKKALEYLDKALLLDPQNEEAQRNRAAVLAMKENSKASIRGQ